MISITDCMTATYREDKLVKFEGFHVGIKADDAV